MHLRPRKQLVVKNLRPQAAWDVDKFFESTWRELEAALVIVFSRGTTDFSIESAYRGVENLCRQDKAQELYVRLLEACRKHVSSIGTGLSLADLLAEWAQWRHKIDLVRTIFFFLDRSYVIHKTKSSLSTDLVKLFRDHVCRDDAAVIDQACSLFTQMRHGTDNPMLLSAISMFHDLATYSSRFEPRLLEVSDRYMAEWASQPRSLREYIPAVEQLVQDETDRCDALSLDSSTKRDLVGLVEKHAVGEVDDDEVAALLDDNTEHMVGRLYSLLQRRSMGASLKSPFQSWILSRGTNIISTPDDMVDRLLEFKSRLDALWRVDFSRDEALGHALRESFDTFLNKTTKSSHTWNTDNSKIGEMIAKHVDTLLSGKSDDNTDMATSLDQVLDLFRFVHGKAVFEAFYKRDLARRLLMGRSASADAERSMLARLKTECGSAFTQNLEQMFRDVDVARDELAAYKALCDERGEKSSLQLSVNVLSASAWPTYADVPVIVPNQVKTALDGFERYYVSKHNGRRLGWKHSLAHCQLRADFSGGKKELVVSSFQAIVLLLFNDVGQDEHLTYDHIKTETGLPEAEIERTLQSLACAKLRPLTKHPRGKEINPTDTFTVNTAFSHQKYRVKINQVQLKETKAENKETHERVAADRNFECQAAIVRIMKGRKTINHSELIAEVLTATRSRGVLAVPDIKKNIDKLIEKEYMEREDNRYHYVA